MDHVRQCQHEEYAQCAEKQSHVNIAAIAWIAVAIQIVTGASAADFKHWDMYPFSLEVPDSLQPFSESDREQFRNNYESHSAEYYKRYYTFNDSPFSAAPYIAAFRTPDFDLTFVALVMRIPPQTNYLASTTKELGDKMEWGKQQGIIKAVHISAPSRVGNYDCITMEADKPNGGQDFIAMLYDEDLPYQVVQLTLMASSGRAGEARQAFEHILKNIHIDYTLRGMVGRQPFVISERCQQFFVVTEISNPDAKRIVFVMQEPHWNWRAQWNLHQGLRVFFNENTNLSAKSAFLSEGVKAMEQTSVFSLSQIEPEPQPILVKAALESFLVTGYLTFNWITGDQIPVFGTEDWALYQESARLWQSDKNAPWAVTVAARNGKMVEVLLQLQSRFDNPILFVGGMHIHAIGRDLFLKGQSTLTANSPSAGKPNRGIRDWLKQRGLDYIYIEPLPDLTLNEDTPAMARYRELFTAQIAGSYDAYATKFTTGYQRRLAAGTYDDGVTVTPEPVEAAKVVALLNSKSGDGDDSDKDRNKVDTKRSSDGGDDSDKTKESGEDRSSASGGVDSEKSISKGSTQTFGGGIRKAIDRFKDAVSKLNLRGKNLKSGRNAIRDADPNLTETIKADTGRHEWKDKKGQWRIAYDPQAGGGHWHKQGPDGTPIDNAGRPDNMPGKPTEHIPAR